MYTLARNILFCLDAERAHDVSLKAMEAAATKGPWECDTTHNEGSYGAGEDVYEGFKSYTILSEDGKVLFDSLNSDAIEVHEEYDEDGATAWDEIARRNAELIVAMRNALPDLLDAAERLERQVRAKQQEIEEIAARAQENYERALAAERLASRAREEALREAAALLDLTKALEPFAKAASDYERKGEFFSNNVELVLRVSVFAAPEYHNSTAVQVGDLRRARSELEAGHE